MSGSNSAERSVYVKWVRGVSFPDWYSLDMLSCHILFVALTLICPGTAFPLSALFGVGSSLSGLSANQLLSLHDGTYLALINSFFPITELALNPRVRTVPFLSQDPVNSLARTVIVARLRPANDSVIWAYAINDFQGPASAVVDCTLSIFVVGEAAFPNPMLDFGFRVLRFSVSGEAIWGELYNDESSEITFFPALATSFSGSIYEPVLIDLAGPRTLAIAGISYRDNNVFGKNTFFIDTITRKVRRVRFPLPDAPGTLEPAGVAADAVSGAACFADAENALFMLDTQRLFVQCANAADGSEVVSRVLVPFQDNTMYGSPRMIMANDGEGKAATLYVVALREVYIGRADEVPRYTFTAADKAKYVNEMLLFKLNPTTLEDVEWESGRTSMKPTMRKLLLPTPARGFSDEIRSLEYIRDRDTLVVLFVSGTVLREIETLPDGKIAFRGSSSIAAEPLRIYQWLLSFGDDPEPAAVRIPDDPRPDGAQDEFDFLITGDLELSEDKRELYLFSSLGRVYGSRYGGLVTFPFPLPQLAKPSAESLAMGDDVGDGVAESFEPNPDELAKPRPENLAMEEDLGDGVNESLEPSPEEMAKLSPESFAMEDDLGDGGDESLEPSPDEMAKPSPESFATGDLLGDGFDESLETGPNEMPNASNAEDLRASPDSIQEPCR